MFRTSYSPCFHTVSAYTSSTSTSTGKVKFKWSSGVSFCHQVYSCKEYICSGSFFWCEKRCSQGLTWPAPWPRRQVRTWDPGSAIRHKVDSLGGVPVPVQRPSLSPFPQSYECHRKTLFILFIWQANRFIKLSDRSPFLETDAAEWIACQDWPVATCSVVKTHKVPGPALSTFPHHLIQALAQPLVLLCICWRHYHNFLHIEDMGIYTSVFFVLFCCVVFVSIDAKAI